MTTEGLVDYAVVIPATAVRGERRGSPTREGSKYGADIDWVLAGRPSTLF